MCSGMVFSEAKLFFSVFFTRENYGVFYHDWRSYGWGKYGGISPKLPIFPVIILPDFASQNFP